MLVLYQAAAVSEFSLLGGGGPVSSYCLMCWTTSRIVIGVGSVVSCQLGSGAEVLVLGFVASVCRLVTRRCLAILRSSSQFTWVLSAVWLATSISC